MKRRISTGISAAALATLSTLALAAAPAQASESTVRAADAPAIANYSAMSDILSCTYYPMRPWCPNASKYA